MAIALTEVGTIIKTRIMPGLVDLYFKNDPLLMYFKNNRYESWYGPEIQENYLFAPENGDAYEDGDNFDITMRQTWSGLRFDPKKYYVNVSLSQSKVEVEAAGPAAAFGMVRTKLANASMTMSAKLAIALYQHGQDLGPLNNRRKHFNGLPEALSDGVNAGWDGTIYTSYGKQTRVDVAPALNSPTGLITTPNVAGPITYSILEHSYQSCVIGAEHPVMGITTNRAVGFINEIFQPQQRIPIDTKEPVIGWPGIKFKQATILESQYCPGADGVNDPDLGNYLASAGETFWWVNPGEEGDGAYIKLHVAQSPKYQFGFTGFKPAQGNDMVAGQILFLGNVSVRAPRLMRHLYGIRQAP